MRTSLVVAASIVIMLIGMVGTAVIFFDEDRVKGLLIAQVERNTGHKVEILGSLELRLFPGLRLEAEQIILRNPGSEASPAFLAADRLEVQLRLLPLIRGRAVADEVRLTGTRLSLNIDREALAGPVSGSGGDTPVAELGLTSGNIILDDLWVDIHDENAVLRQSFAVEQMQLSGFALDRPVAFRFSGNIGQPPLFDQLDVSGRLITRPTGRFQLDDMRLVGSLDGGRYALELRGNVAFQAGVESVFSLVGGQLSLNQYQFDVDLVYQGLERPYLSAVVGGQLLDVDTFMLLDQLAMLPHDSSRAPSLAAISGFDFDIQLDLVQVGRFGLVIQDLTTELRARQGRLSFNRFRAAVPGGLVGGQGELDLGVSDPRWQLQAELELAEAEHLFSLLWAESELSGAGRLGLVLESVGPATVTAALPWQGHGHLRLWEGRFGMLGFLNDALGEAATADGGSFSSLEAAWLVSPEKLEWQSLRMFGLGWTADGDFELFGPQGRLSGNLQLSDDQGSVRFFELGGSLAQPELLVPPIVLATSP